VAEPDLDRLDVNASGDEQAGVCVPEIVEADLWETREKRCRLYAREGIVKGDERSLQHVASSLNHSMQRTTRLIPRIARVDEQYFMLTSDLEVGTGLNAEDVCLLGIAYIFEWRLLRRLRKCPIDGC